MTANSHTAHSGVRNRLRILGIGAHPDDCELSCGGTAALWSRQGHEVTFLSVTNGQSGHHGASGVQLIARRAEEARRAASVIGAESQILPLADGYLVPSIENRLMLIRAIRVVAPDVIVTNRPHDYHPDHRHAAQLVLDAAYSLMVPNIAPDVPALSFNPIILHWWDPFKLPVPFDPVTVVSVDQVFEEKLEMLHQHESQMYEWLPWIEGYAGEVPAASDERRDWLRGRYKLRVSPTLAERYREQLRARYGSKGDAVMEAEAVELCEYGAQPSPEELARLFDFSA